MECCACGLPLVLRDGQTNLAKFEVNPVPQRTAAIVQACCRTCARRITAAWARKFGGKAKPRDIA
jgi:hypothetical protein